MVRTVKIGNSDYDLKSSAYTIFAYKDKMGRDLLIDINYLNNKYIELEKKKENEQKDGWIEEITSLIEKSLKLAYIMIKESNPSFKEYDEWLRDLDNLFENISWVQEVLEAGISPFFGRI